MVKAVKAAKRQTVKVVKLPNILRLMVNAEKRQMVKAVKERSKWEYPVVNSIKAVERQLVEMVAVKYLIVKSSKWSNRSNDHWSKQ